MRNKKTTFFLRKMYQFANIKAKPFFIFLFMIGIIIFITTYITLMKNGDYETENTNNIDDANPLVIEAKNFSSVPNSAFAFLAMGAQANQMNCPAAIESLVRYGGWDGDIFLITDQSYCFDPKEIIRNAGIKNSNKFHYIVTKESFSRGGIDFQRPKIGFRQSRVRSFAMKTQLFDLIPPETGIDVIAYVDCDILFAKLGCPEKFIQAGSPWKENMIKFSHVAADDNGYVTDLHAGTFVIHRKHSAEILRKWKEQILSGTDEGDNNAFVRLYHQHDLPLSSSDNTTFTETTVPSVATTEIIKNLKENAKQSKHEFFLPNQWSLSSLLIDMNETPRASWNWFEKFIDPITMNTPKTVSCMNHISKARCSSYGREKIQSFVNQFHLKTYSDGYYSYCTHSTLQPLLYGWFPFGYLPYCPKMEMIL